MTSLWRAGPDGTAWVRQGDEPAFAGLWEADLRAFASRTIAIGSRSEGALVPTVWILDPGAAWTAETVSLEPGARLTDVALIGGAPLVVGTMPAGDGTTHGAAWRQGEPAS